MITCELARNLLEKSGVVVTDIELIPEGSNHKVFIVTTEQSKMICKFPIKRETEVDHNMDTLFGGELSLAREESIYNITRALDVPAPEVYDFKHMDGYDFILIELMKGQSLTKHIDSTNYSKSSFLEAIKYLGRDCAKIQKIHFKSFGDLINETSITPPGLINFADRFESIVSRRIKRTADKGAFTSDEVQLVQDFFMERLSIFRPLLDISNKPATLVFTDMHADNFFVDNTGQPSGYFDLESSQAAPAELEFYGFRFFLFNYFDEETMIEAERLFFDSYITAGGLYAPTHQLDHELIDFLSACRLLELTESYWGHKDGLRDLWAFKMKTLLMQYIFTLKVDYITLADIFREKTKQPKTPN
jgi:tRNA A-37 threonylcarbamoyl transferase component Bud32